MNEKLHELIESGNSKKNDNDEENIQLVRQLTLMRIIITILNVNRLRLKIVHRRLRRMKQITKTSRAIKQIL